MPRTKSSPTAIRHAHDLRHKTTEAESKLWSYLRAHRLNDLHFRRQHAIGPFIVDFCAPEQRLIIELDGSQHLEHEKQDRQRSAYLESKGYRILRFWNHDVLNHLEEVIRAIELELIDLDHKS